MTIYLEHNGDKKLHFVLETKQKVTMKTRKYLLKEFEYTENRRLDKYYGKIKDYLNRLGFGRRKAFHRIKSAKHRRVFAYLLGKGNETRSL